MHVLLITTAYKNKFNPVNSLFYFDQAKALLSNGCKVGVICPMPITIPNILKSKRFNFSDEFYNDSGIPTYVKPFISYPKLKKRTARVRLEKGKQLFKKYIEENGTPDIIHVHTFLAGEIAIWIKETYKISYIVTEHSSGFVRNNYNKNAIDLAEEVYSKSQHNVAVSEPFCALLTDKFRKQFTYIPNVVDTHFFKPQLKKAENKIFTFLNIANLDKNKNQIGLIKAFKKTFFGQENYHLRIVGDGPEFKKLSAFINNEELNSQVHLLGRQKRDQVKLEIQRSDCFVLSSFHETFGVVLIEAMSCGVPVISSKSGGPESIITDSKLGVLCDLENLEHELLKITNAEFDSSYIRKYVIDNFSEDVISSRLISIFKESKNS